MNHTWEPPKPGEPDGLFTEEGLALKNENDKLEEENRKLRSKNNKLEAQLTMAEDIIANSMELIDSLLKAFNALGLRIGEDGDIRNEKYLIAKGSEGYDEMKEIIETLKKEKNRNER